MMRNAGILCPLFSLPSRYGIGCLDRAAYDFVDFLAAAGQRYWQMLPPGPTEFGDSPYKSVSAFAGNPYFISVDVLAEEGYLTRDEVWAADATEDPWRVNYDLIFARRMPLLRLAFTRFCAQGGPKTKEFLAFQKKEAHWLPDYALFMAIKDSYDGAPFYEWPKPLKKREAKALAQAKKDFAKEIAYYSFLQYCFFAQWEALHRYANDKGVELIGDMPFYASGDSADCWAHPEIFALDAGGEAALCAGCPPDAFSEDGQFWGNPVYRWTALKKSGYRWWFDRIKLSLRLFDLLRIDHFRGFESFYVIPKTAKSAREGKWKKGPGMAFFNALQKESGKLPLIAEDLGMITDDVRALLKETGFPGMAVLQFAFDDSMASLYLPHKVKENTIVYTGTHDNTTTRDWVEKASDFERDFARRYIRSVFTDYGAFTWDMIRAALGTPAKLCVIPIADYLCKGAEGRINTPGTVGENWKLRLLPGELSAELAEAIRRETKLYGRC